MVQKEHRFIPPPTLTLRGGRLLGSAPVKDVFECQDNNDGQLLIDVADDGIKYAFVSDLGETKEPMTPAKYMVWDHKHSKYKDWEKSECISQEQKDRCKENISYIMDNFQMMTKEEVDEFIEHDYVSDMGIWTYRE